MSEQKRVLVLSVSSGSGHTRAAQAIEAYCDSHELTFVEHVDTLKYADKLYHTAYADAYEKIVKEAPMLWGYFFEKTDEPGKTDKMRLLLDRIHMRAFSKMLKKYQPDLVVCTHFMPAEIVARLVRKERLKTKLAIVVTDFYVHAMWLTRGCDHYFVALEESKAYLSLLGYPEEGITVSGIPIDPKFTERYDRDQLRAAYGLDLNRPVVLLSAGTFGMDAAFKAVESLVTLKTACQIVVVCGRNDDLKSKVDQFVEQHVGGNVSFLVLGYTTEMHKLMAMADLFIGKPGGLTTSECLAMGLPMVVFNPIPGQEERNSDFLLENGAAIKCGDLAMMSFKIDRLLQDPERLRSMQDSASKLGFPAAAECVVETLRTRYTEKTVKDDLNAEV